MLLRLAWRSVWRHRRRTVITITSIALGLGFVVVFVCLGEGVYHQLVTDAARLQAGHVTVEHRQYRDAPEVGLRVADAVALRTRLARDPDVATAKLLVLGQGLARSGADAVGVAVMGVEPSIEAHTSPLARRITSGRYLEDGDDAHVVVGTVLADRLDLTVGKKLVLSTNDAEGDLVEALFRVRGVFETGAEEIDGWLVQAPLAATQRLYGLRNDEVTQIGLVARRPEDQPALLGRVRAIVDDPEVVVLPWQTVIPELAAFIRLDRVSDWTFEGLLVVIVLFTIFNTLLMSVLERTREFAVLVAIGTSPGQVAAQILVESLLITALGVAGGLVFGGTIAGLLQAYGLDLRLFMEEGLTVSGLALSSRLHARVTVRTLAWISALVAMATVPLAVVPMRRALRIDVAEVLR